MSAGQRSDEEMKYLAMRAKKMTAHRERVPSPEVLMGLFAKKSTEINKREANRLVDAIKEHRTTVGVGGRKPGHKHEVSGIATKKTARYGTI